MSRCSFTNDHAQAKKRKLVSHASQTHTLLELEADSLSDSYHFCILKEHQIIQFAI